MTSTNTTPSPPQRTLDAAPTVGRSLASPRRWVGFVLGLACLSSAFATSLPANPKLAKAEPFRPGEFTGLVTRVSDGDTVWVALPAGTVPVKLRLEGIDAPESCQAWGNQAQQALAARIHGRVITVKLRSLDAYGRRLGKLYDDTDDVGAFLVAQGHAWSLRRRTSLGPYIAQERTARESRRGLHAASDTQMPSDFRRSHGPCPWPTLKAQKP